MAPTSTPTSTITPSSTLIPYGLFGESFYESAKERTREVLGNPRFQGVCQMVGGLAEMGAGTAIAGGSYGLATPIGFSVFTHGVDHFTAGMRSLISGNIHDTATSQIMQKAGLSATTANFLDNTTSMTTTMCGTLALRTAQQAFTPRYRVPPQTASKETIPKLENKLAFPKNPNDLLPNAFRDKKGYIYASDYIRIKPEKHLVKNGNVYNPRHHGQHYHIEIRYDSSISWGNIKNTYYLKSNNYEEGMGTGFLPGEHFPGS